MLTVLCWVKFVQGELLKMQHIKKRIAKMKKNGHTHSKPVCFFCDAVIKSGEEIIARKDEGFYHRKCYDFLFTLKASLINFE